MSELVLHGYWRSSASYRVRIALALKQVAVRQVTYDLRTGAHLDEAYRAIAPQALVPSLLVDGVAVPQSGAIIEWLEERYPDPPLLPAEPIGRAVVRAMAATIGCDIHPLNNLRVMTYLKGQLGADDAAVRRWMAHWIATGLDAVEAMIERYGDGLAFGRLPSMADCFLVPQLYNAERFGIDVSRYPRANAANSALLEIAGVAAAHPDCQPAADPA